MTNKVNLTELEKARRLGKIGDIIGMSVFGLIALGALGLILWGVGWLVVVHPTIGLPLVGVVSLIGLVAWSAAMSSRADKLEEAAKRYGVIDE